MIVLTHLAVGAATGLLAGVPLEIAKHYINSIWEDDKEISNLKKELAEEFDHLESKKSLRVGDRFHSRCPPDWLDELEICNYDYEDIQECTNPKVRKKIVVDYLKTYLKYVKLTSTELTNEPREDSNPQDYDCSVYTLLSSREKCKSEIIENLISKNTNRFGVSIIGMGGIGKTVLARAIEDQTSKGHFHVISTPKSPNFNLKAALACIESKKPPSKDERVLILLDGLHRVKHEDWSKFRSKCDEILHLESKVLITTQNPQVADMTGTSKYCVPPLLGDECFSFICNLVSNLEVGGDKIAIEINKKDLIASCRGLPLLANQIGMLLSGEAVGNRTSIVREITTRNLWEVEGLKRVLLNQELVSLLEQKPALIRCLAFCSLFPLGYEFEQDDLLQFWMAGVTLASTDATWMETTTKEYFDDLHSCSLFQTSASLPAQQPRYKLSRLFYDMALNVASKTFCHNHITKFTRHVSLSCEKTENSGDIDMDGLLSDLVSSCTSLRTFLFVNESGAKVKDPTFFKKLKRLRVLDLRHTCIRKLEKKHISGLKFLRYLDLSHSQVERLPTLSNSSKLQVLKLHKCAHLEDLNNDLAQLTNLISLEVNQNSLKSLPSNIGKLINLRRLDTFVVGKSEGFKIAELRNLNSLRKSLVIKKLENVESKEEAVKAMLSSKIWLDKLELKWSSLEQNGTAEQVLEGLQPPNLLTELKISNYSGTNFPQWFNEVEVCGALKSIHLNSCRALPSVDKLQQLKTLRIEAMQDILREGSTGFINVETLVLYNMSRVDWCMELAAGRMLCLQNLQVDKCEKLKQLPPLENITSLKKLELIGCTEMRELPALPRSLVRLIIKDSNTLEERCQSGGADLHKIRGIAVEINSPPSEPDSTAAGQPSSSSQVVIDSTPVNTSKPDSTAAGQPSSSSKILTDSTPVNTSVSDATAACQPRSSSQVVTDPTAASHPSTRIEEANGHETTSPNLRCSEFESITFRSVHAIFQHNFYPFLTYSAPVNTSDPDSTAASQPSSKSQVVTDSKPADMIEPNPTAASHSSTRIETPKGHKITSPDLRRVECKVSEGGSEPASTIEGQLATGHPSTKVEAANEHQTTSSNLRHALVNTSELDSTAAGQQSSRSQVATDSKPTELIEPNPTAASHSSTRIEHTPYGHQIHSPDLQRVECKVSEGGSKPASTVEGHLATGHPSTKVETTSPNFRRGPDSTTRSNPSSSNDNVNDSTTADTNCPETTEIDHPSKQVEDSSLANQNVVHQSNHGEEKSASLRSRLFGRLRCILCYA